MLFIFHQTRHSKPENAILLSLHTKRGHDLDAVKFTGTPCPQCGLPGYHQHALEWSHDRPTCGWTRPVHRGTYPPGRLSSAGHSARSRACAAPAGSGEIERRKSVFKLRATDLLTLTVLTCLSRARAYSNAAKGVSHSS